MIARLHQSLYVMQSGNFYIYLTLGGISLNETDVEFEMSKEELERFIMSIPQILKELEESILVGKGEYST